MSEEVKFYSVPHHYCSCRDEYNNLRNIGRNYRKFYTFVKEGSKNVDVLNMLKMKKMCCRAKFLSISYIPMIDRSKDRFFSDIDEKITFKTRTLEFKNPPPAFPLIGVK